MATQITATLPSLDFPKEVDYPTQEDWAAFSAAAELNFGILGNGWSTQMQLWKTEANAMSTEFNTNATIAQGLANYQGDWTSKGYTLGQTVSVSGVYYICKLTHATGQNPTAVGSLYWNLALGNWNLKVDTDMSGYTSKTTPIDADLIPLSDSSASFGIKKLSWANLKANLSTGFKNYIINGKKVINQRALTSTNDSYNQDRWYKAGNNWFQGIEGDNNLISGKKYTLSWVGNATASYYVGTATSATISAQTFTSIANGGNFTLTISAGQILWIKFASDSTGSTFNFVQLEEGSVATPFENRPVGLELSLCQRYYEVIQLNTNTYQLNGAVFGYSAPFTVPKRVPPSIVVSSVAYINATNINASAVNQSSINGLATATATGICNFSVLFIAVAEL